MKAIQLKNGSLASDSIGNVYRVPDDTEIIDKANEKGDLAGTPGFPRWILRCNGRETNIDRLDGAKLTTATIGNSLAGKVSIVDLFPVVAKIVDGKLVIESIGVDTEDNS